VRHLITEWDIEPSRPDWEQVLSDTESRYERWQVLDRRATG
jgi:hypothetical protein